MKTTLLYFFLVCSLSLVGQKQQTCGFDQVIQKQDKTYPGLRQTFDQIIQKIQMNKKDDSSLGFDKKVNEVSEIPIVVHVIYPNGAEVGSTYNKSDKDIEDWLERANQMFAGTYAWPVGSVRPDLGNSEVFPIRLVLAKRDPNCNATTGIIRYNGGIYPNYNTYGVSLNTSNGIDDSTIRNIAPHWPEDTYFNIYIISMFDGDPAPYSGVMGFASLPNDTTYDSFMKSGVISEPNGTVFVHELGHALGLLHTFNGANSLAAPGTSDYCPSIVTGNCAKDDDKVCDTERSGSAYSISPIPSNSDINPCTGKLYEGVQYNFMNYGRFIARKFTAGQRKKTIATFTPFRNGLTTSLGGRPLSSAALSNTPIAASCIPAGITNMGTYLAGPMSVKLGQINNSSIGIWYGDPSFYIDYTKKGCFNSMYTQLLVSKAQTIEIGFFQNPHAIRVWIDYNNDGTFETSELVASGNDIPIGADLYGTFTASFTPPPTAVLNTPLRMRVLADLSASSAPSPLTPCGNLGYGQIEDYAVELVTNILATSEVKAENDDLTIYPNPVATEDYIFIKAKNAKNLKVAISDMSGRMVASPSVTEEGNGIFKVNQQLEKGVYMVQVSNGKDSKTSKLIIK